MPNYFELRKNPKRARILSGLERLRDQLDTEIPDRSLDKTLRLASWNIREFDSGSYGVRTPDAMYFIAEIISRFDLVAVQEVRRDLEALRKLMRHLGWEWRYLVTDTTEGTRGNNERLAFLYDTRKVRFTGLASELVLPDLKVGGEVVRPDQIARTPFTAGFRAGWVQFQLATVHILYGEDKAVDPERLAEIQAVAKFLADRSKDETSSMPNIVLLGDFNIYARTDATLVALTDAGWTIPKPLLEIPGSNVAKDKFYDQIAISSRANQFHPAGPAGVFDYYESVFRKEDQASYIPDMGEDYDVTSKGAQRTEAGKATYYKSYWRTYQMSDHLPMWVDLQIDYSDSYLQGLAPIPEPPDPQDLI